MLQWMLAKGLEVSLPLHQPRFISFPICDVQWVVLGVNVATEAGWANGIPD